MMKFTVMTYEMHELISRMVERAEDRKPQVRDAHDKDVLELAGMLSEGHQIELECWDCFAVPGERCLTCGEREPE